MSDVPTTPAPGDPPKRGRGRPRKDSLPPALAAPTAPGVPPARTADGRANPEHYRVRISFVTQAAEKAALSGASIPFNAEALVKMIYREAELAGIKPEGLADARTEAEKNLDTLRAMKEMPDEAFAVLEERTDSILKLQDVAMSVTSRGVSSITSKLFGEYAKEAAALAQAGKRWTVLLAKIQKARQQAKKKFPTKQDEGNHTIAASHVLRYMAYVGRSSLVDSKRANDLFEFGLHHGVMAAQLYEAENKGRFGPTGLFDTVGNGGGWPYKGAIIVCPPGHGKTEFAAHWATLRISENPAEQFLFTHAVEGEAIKNLKYVAGYFSPDTPRGRRNISLFPYLKLASSDNNANMMRLELPNAARQQTIRAHGIGAKASGSSASKIWFDDPVDQVTVYQEVERKRTSDRINGTWLTRLRGQETFNLTTTTLWHPDDANARRVQLVRDGKLWLRISVQGCGGPNSSPKFKPLWPEQYPARDLSSKYREMKNPGLYAAAYMSDPRSEDRKLIKKVRIYDRNAPDHVRFLASSTKRLSLDPAASRSSKADRAGIVYCAEGLLQSQVTGPDGEAHTEESRLRILSADQIHATQSDLADFAKTFCLTHKVDYVHIETVLAFVGLAEMFENQYSVDVIRHNPNNLANSQRSKGERLRAAAPLLEDANAATGLRAVVEFPGHINELGHLEADEEIKWLIDQVENFGACAEDHGVDALTQLVNHLAPNLGVGMGAASVAVAQAVTRTSRMQEWWKSQREQDGTANQDRSAQMEDAEWLSGQNIW